MARTTTRRTFCLGAVSAAAIATGCAPGGSTTTSQPTDTGAPVKTDVAAMGNITLTAWDGESGSGASSVYDALNKAFEAKYPNVKITRVSKTFDDHKTTLKLAISGNNPPDVVQSNQGYSDNAAFVKAGAIEPLTRWNEVYKWTDFFPASQIALNSVSADGKTLGTGNLYGVSATGEVVGVYMNTAKLAKLGLQAPTTMAELVAMLPKIKAAGEVGIEFGNADKYPAIHLLGNTVGTMSPQPPLAKLVFGQSGSWTSDPMPQAAATIAGWAKQGYLDPGFSGNSSDIAADRFGKGTGLFLVGGTWYQQAFTKALGKDVSFAVLPGSSGSPVSLGGVGLGWAIPSRSDAKDAAAAYINFITGPDAMKMMADADQLAAVPPTSFKPKAGTVAADVLSTWTKMNATNGLVPYLDWATPTFYDTITSQLQQLLAGRKDSTAFTQALQTDYAAFRKS